ncbi:glycosyltransferase family 4 protein [soil metagenome]
MHILILCKKFPYPLKDGEVIAIYNNIKAFHRLGHQVTVLAINTLKHYTDVATLPAEVLQLAEFKAVTVDTAVKPLAALKNLFTGGSYHIERFINKGFETLLVEQLASRKFDLVQCEGLYLGPYVGVIRKHYKGPVVMRSHNVESEIWERLAANEKNSFKKWYLTLQASRLKRYELAQLNRYDAIVPISPDDERKMREMGATVPMFTTPCGSDLDRYEPYQQSTPNPHSIFFIGGLDWLPNQEGVKWFVEEVWPVLRQKYPNLEFYVAGRNMPAWMKNLEGNGVHILGEIEDALGFIAESAIMIVPLFSGSGMRIKIIEGMAMKKAIVSTAIGAEGISYTDGRDILIANTKAAFIKHIDALLVHPQQVRNMGENARTLIESRYNNLTFAGQLIEFYQRIFAI